MRDFNLFLLLIGGMTLGGIACAIAQDTSERPLRHWECAALVGLAFIIMYGIENIPNLGG